MTENVNRTWAIRTVLISAIVGVLVYAYGRSDSVVIERFHEIAYGLGTWQNHWLGIPAMQNPNDAWIIQEIISETKPDLIIEAGTAMGGSALVWATILREVNPSGRIITIDIVNNSKEVRKLALAREMIQFIIGSSTDPKVVSEISGEAKGKRVLVILDSNHTRDHVLEELRSYTPLIQIGGYVVVQDSDIYGHPIYLTYGEPKGPGPYEAIDAFMAENHSFEIDLSRERLLYTTNPHGYLKRVRPGDAGKSEKSL